MLKNPTYSTFMNEVDEFISNLSNDDLKKIIMNLAEQQNAKNRNDFLKDLKKINRNATKSEEFDEKIESSPDEFITQIEKFDKRIQSGEFFDEERNYWAYEQEERSYWGGDDYYDDLGDIDFSEEEYVQETIEYLETAKNFFRKKDIHTAFKAYCLLFDILNNSEYYESECFIYGFSFEEALDGEFLKEHKALYLRCLYLNCTDKDDFRPLYQELITGNNIYLSDVIEIAREPLPRLDEFIDSFIEFLHPQPEQDSQLIDVLFIKGGMEEIKKYAYLNGANHPIVFLYYYEAAKDNILTPSEKMSILLDGINLIPEKYYIRSYLSRDLIEIASELKDKQNLLTGYSTAFYSNPTLRNFAYYINFIFSENITSEVEKLRTYSRKYDIKTSMQSDFYYEEGLFHQRNIYTMKSVTIGTRTIILARYLLEDIDPLIKLIDTQNYLGFSSNNKHIAIIASLILKSVSRDATVVVVDSLLDHYCFETDSAEYYTLKRLVENRTKQLSIDQYLDLDAINKIESLAVNRVSHILNNQKRGGYESSCLLLVACAEVKQLVSKNGNALISRIDAEYKRFRAFRKPLKMLTLKSKYLTSVN